MAPAAHYMIGGVVTDDHGRSTLPGLYAVGECACTGVHGANRLASNSLSECFVFGRRAALAALDEPPAAAPRSAAARAAPPGPHARPRARPCGATPGRCATPPGSSGCAPIRTRWRALIARSRAARGEETRGCHLRADFPATDPALDARHLDREPRRRRLAGLELACGRSACARRSRFTSGIAAS